MPTDINTLAQQIIDLQSQLAFQEDAILNLDKALALQQQELLELRAQVAMLHERQRAAFIEGVATQPPADEKPPHY